MERFPSAKGDDRFIRDAAQKLIGREVVIEGTFPVPVPHPQTGEMTFVYCPDRGKLTDVFEDGFALLKEGRAEAALYMFVSIRSIQPLSPLTTGPGFNPGGIKGRG